MVDSLTRTQRLSAPLPHHQARLVSSHRSCRILVANAKGGCGKSTLATNLAAWLAQQNPNVALIDYDPQGSSTQWLQARSEKLPSIYSVAAFRQATPHATRSFQLKVPANTTHVVMDTAAGLTGNELSDMLRLSDIVLMPVVPSAIDIRAATTFIKEVLLSPGFRKQPKPIAVIANRVKKNTLGYNKLAVFLNSLNIPFITALRDTQHYVRASEYGMGIYDFSQPHKKDLEEWHPLLLWLSSQLDLYHGQYGAHQTPEKQPNRIGM